MKELRLTKQSVMLTETEWLELLYSDLEKYERGLKNGKMVRRCEERNKREEGKDE